MDKYEYKVRVDEIKALIAEGGYEEAVKIADTIDWRRVKSVMMLCTISDLYKINKRYEDSRDILLLAYERHTGGRLIVYSLCELSIKLGEYVQALEYYKEFVQLAPKDSGRFILQYRLYEAQEVSLEERIGVLEELKKHDYREKWAFELATLYHRVGMETQCVNECEQIMLWFGEGRYVLKALELKMQHEPLTPEQQEKYDLMKQDNGNITQTAYPAEEDNIREDVEEDTSEEDTSLEDTSLQDTSLQDDDEFSLQENIMAENTQELPGKDLDIQVKTVDVSQYNTINLQKELAESMKEFLQESKPMEEKSYQEENSTEEDLMITQVFEPVSGLDSKIHPVIEKEEKTNFHQDTDEMQLITEKEEVFFGNTEEVNIEDVVSELASRNKTYAAFTPIGTSMDTTSAINNTGVIKTFHKPSGYDNILSQEYDGQISLVVPEQEQVEKQITGQISIEDVMAEWEKMKKDSERKRMEEIRKRVHQQTDTLFADFDESTKSGLLEELEKAMVSAAIKEEKTKAYQEKPKVVKIADIAELKEEKAPNPEKKAISEIKEKLQETEDIQEIEDIQETEDAQETQDTQETENIQETEDAQETQDTQETENIQETEDTQETQDTQETKNIQKAEATQEKKDNISDASQDTINKYKAREMTDAEKTLFAPFIHHKKTRKQIVEVIDNISMASYSGNVVISGEEGTGTTALAKLLVKEVQSSDNNFSGKVAKISGVTMNKKDIGSTLAKLSNGALIIEGATAMKTATVEQLVKELNQEDKGLIVLLEDTKPGLNEFLTKFPELEKLFPLRVDVEALDDQTLVKYAKKYALQQEYGIDELGVLALHTRIADMQTSDHEVTLAEIEELIDEAIYYADRKTPKHFFDVLFGKRYDEEDMIILREKDFMHI